jgi:hypothetical protein
MLNRLYEKFDAISDELGVSKVPLKQGALYVSNSVRGTGYVAMHISGCSSKRNCYDTCPFSGDKVSVFSIAMIKVSLIRSVRSHFITVTVAAYSVTHIMITGLAPVSMQLLTLSPSLRFPVGDHRRRISRHDEPPQGPGSFAG